MAELKYTFVNQHAAIYCNYPPSPSSPHRTRTWITGNVWDHPKLVRLRACASHSTPMSSGVVVAHQIGFAYSISFFFGTVNERCVQTARQGLSSTHRYFSSFIHSLSSRNLVFFFIDIFFSRKLDDKGFKFQCIAHEVVVKRASRWVWRVWWVFDSGKYA